MNIDTGYFAAPDEHHIGWFRVFKFKGEHGGGIEIWMGPRWINVNWGKK